MRVKRILIGLVVLFVLPIGAASCYVDELVGTRSEPTGEE